MTAKKKPTKKKQESNQVEINISNFLPFVARMLAKLDRDVDKLQKTADRLQKTVDAVGLLIADKK